MASNYDLSDPSSIQLMKGLFDRIREGEWEEYIEFTKEPEHKNSFSFEERGILMKAKKYAGRSDRLSLKQVRWAMNLVDQIDDIQSDENQSEEAEEEIKKETFSMPPSHVTLRVAWHDNKWNGTICNDPDQNYHCSGFNSLLSDRIRREKRKNIDKEREHAGKKISSIDYVPPCFWSVNLFGSDPITVEHFNPAAREELDNIKEELPASSMFSWPYALSFCRSESEKKNYGDYPGNLESVRIPRFKAKLHEGASIGFMYANYSNPLTEEEQQYLVVGCGLIIDKKDDIPEFGPESEIQKIRESRPKGQNFPKMNWALRLSFESPKVRMPYHEYLDYSDTIGLNEEQSEELLDKIKVAITEPELEPCFKYVAMDIGDDEAIYLLTKMRKSLIECRDDGIVDPDEMQQKIDTVNELLEFCWNKRSYFPGFSSLSKVLLGIEKNEFGLKHFIQDFNLSNYEYPDEELLGILNDPTDYEEYSTYRNDLWELKDKIDQYGLSIDQFLRLAMLNLNTFQFKRVLKGKLKLPDKWINDIQTDVTSSHSVEEISDNPYLLFEEYEYWEDSHDDVYGEELDAPIDLFKIDIAYFPHTRFLSRIGLQRELSYKDKRRLRAITIRYLRTLENVGHCFSDAKNLEEGLKAYPLFYNIGEEYTIPSKYFEKLDSEVINHFQENQNKIKIIQANDTFYFYLYEVYNAEQEIEEVIEYLIDEPDLNQSYSDIDSYLEESLDRLDNTLKKEEERELFVEERKELYDNIFRKKFYALTGSPGSGKSYEILNIVQEYQDQSQSCLVLTPTGKAALRLSNEEGFEGIEAYTIDKLLADVRNSKIPRQELRSINNLIVDEISMVDLMKFNELLKIISFKAPSFKRLILVGDPNQLPAIGYGKVLSDILYFLKSRSEYHDNFIKLQSNCRQELKEHNINDLAWAFTTDGDLSPKLDKHISEKKESISEGLTFKYWSTAEDLYSAIKNEFSKLAAEQGITGDKSEQLNQMLGLKKDGSLPSNREITPDKFQILTPYHGDIFGTSRINDLFQDDIKSDKELKIGDGWYKFGDKVIRTKNYYEQGRLQLSNGTIGFVHDGSGTEWFNFPQKDHIENLDFKKIRKNEQEHFDLAYSITVHKSQGSGFDHVFLVLPQKYGLLSKELVYTALTRSKKTLTIFIQESEKKSAEELLKYANNRAYTASRRTSLLLDKPFRYYSLEPEKGIFVQSRVELLIYHILMGKREELDKSNFDFEYEKYPEINGTELRIKTDFTLYTSDETWYWEHLGKLGERRYEQTWNNLKRESYKDAGLIDNLITTDELEGINPEKIESIVEKVINKNIETEDPNNQYSLHHYSLR